MAYISIYEDIIFVEGEINNVSKMEKVSYKYGSFGAHLKNLNDVKKMLAKQVKSKNCNCIINFKYGQKSSWLSLDDTKLWAEGICGIIPQEDYMKLITDKKV